MRGDRPGRQGDLIKIVVFLGPEGSAVDGIQTGDVSGKFFS